MTSVIEMAIRKTVAEGFNRIAAFNRAHAKASNEPHPYLSGIHTPMREELTLTKLDVKGSIPPELDGRYLRIGPNPAGQPNPARYHWFTGDGMVHGVRIKDGQALWYRNRWVRTTRVSQALGEAAAPGPRLYESAVNTNIIGQAGRLWALVEAGGTPVELDGDLTTRAHNPFDGTLRGAFSAHPHRDPESGELHAITYCPTDLNHVHHLVVDANAHVVREEPIAVNHGPSIHDCAITKRFVLVFDFPVTFSFAALIAGYEFPFRWDERHPSRVGLLGRDALGDTIIWCAVDPCYVYHACNAYDLEDGRVVADLVVHNCNSYRDYRGPDAEEIRFERWTIDPVSRSVERSVIDSTAQEFPRMDERRTGKPYRYAYSLCVPVGASDVIGKTAILKHDLVAGTRTVHDFVEKHLPGEFVFVPRAENAAEDDGWLIGFVIDQAHETTALTILDAHDFAAPPVAEILLPHRVPPGFHSNWVAAEINS